MNSIRDGAEHRAQSTEHRAQSTEHRAQSTEHRAQSTDLCSKKPRKGATPVPGPIKISGVSAGVAGNNGARFTDRIGGGEATDYSNWVYITDASRQDEVLRRLGEHG